MAYSYYERFFIEFDSMPNGDGDIFHYRVSLQQRLHLPAMSSAPTPIRLEGGPSPFVVSLQNDDDPLKPLRTASARISFANDISLAELLAADAFEWRVTLTRVEDAKRVFVGYLTAEVYTQPAVDGPTIFTVNAASPMAAISATAMPLEDKGMVTIGELISMAIDTTVIRDIDRVYIPAIYSTKNNASAKDYAEILKWKFSTSQYVNNDYADDGMADKYSPYSEALTSICELFGLAIVDQGDGSLYFISPAYQGAYMEVGVSQLTGSFTPTLSSPAFIDSTALFSIDNADTVEYWQGIGGVRLTASAQNIDIALPSIESSVKEQTFSRKTVTAQKYSGDSLTPTSYNAEVATIETVVDARHFKLPKYYLTIDSSGSPVWNEVSDEALDKQGSVGAYYKRFDWCNPADLEPDAETPKRSWSFTDALMVNDVGWYASSGQQYNVRLPDSLPLIKVEINDCFVGRGALVIDFALMASAIEGFYMVEDNVFEGGNIEGSILNLSKNTVAVDTKYWLSAKNIEMSLRIGDRFFNGSSWVSRTATFSIPVSVDKAQWHPVSSNKTVDMLYEGDSGYYIPVDAPMSGALELCVYPSFYPFSGVSQYSGSVPFSYLKGLSLSFAANIETRIATDADLTFSRVFGNSYKDQITKTLKLHSKVNAAEQSSLIYDAQGLPLDTLYRTTSVDAAKPEQFLLDEYERVYGRAQRRWRRGTWCRDLNPADVYNIATSDSAGVLTGYTADYSEAVIEMYISDVKTIKMMKYVE